MCKVSNRLTSSKWTSDVRYCSENISILSCYRLQRQRQGISRMTFWLLEVPTAIVMNDAVLKNKKSQWHVSLLCFKYSGHRCANGRDVCRTHRSTWGFRLRTIVYFFVYRKSWPGTERMVHLEARGCQCSFKFRGNTSSWAWIAILDSWYARRLIISLYLKLLMVTLAERRVHLHTRTCWYFPPHNETWFTDFCHK